MQSSKTKILYIILALVFGVVLNGFSQQKIIISPDNPLLKVGKRVQFLEDQNNNLSIQDILKPQNQKKFKLHSKEVYNLPASKTSVWFKITVQNNSNKDIISGR